MANSLSFDNSEYIEMALENSLYISAPSRLLLWSTPDPDTAEMNCLKDHLLLKVSFKNPSFIIQTYIMQYDMNAVCQQNDAVYRIPQHLLSSPQYCQPYLDHSYAASASSASSSGVDVVSHVTPLATAEPLETLAAYIDIEDVSCNTTVVTAPMDQGDASDDSNGGDPWEGSVTRCICDFQHDDGYMICCDRCGVWQHVDCMGVDRNNIPESYLCELCHPRPFDKRRAIRLQAMKKEQMESEMSATDSSSEDQVGSGGGGARGSGRKRKEPTRRRIDGAPPVTQANRPPTKRRTTSELGDDKPNGRKNRQLTNIKTPASRGARRPSTGESSTRTRRNSAFDAQHHVTIDHSVEDVCQNSYTNGVLMLLASVKEREVAAGKSVATSTPINPSLLKEQISQARIRLAHFGPDAKGIAATETIRVNQAVAEYTGRVMMADEYELDNQLNMFMPFVLRYVGAQGVNVCIDSSISGNDARYVRCSCMPNAKVVHVIEQSTIRFFLCATKNIAEGREVTIPFYFDYQKCHSEVLCACHRASCQVARFFKQKSSSRPVRVRRNAAFVVPEVKPRASASTEVMDNGKGTATPSGVRQNSRRSAMSSEMRKTTQVVMSSDVGSDITLMNALTAISSTTALLESAAARSTICSTDGQPQPNGGHANRPLGASDVRPEPSAAAATRSSVALMRESAKSERGRKAAGVGRNRNQSPTETTSEASVSRVGTVRSSRLRDKAQQQLASLPNQKD